MPVGGLTRPRLADAGPAHNDKRRRRTARCPPRQSAVPQEFGFRCQVRDKFLSPFPRARRPGLPKRRPPVQYRPAMPSASRLPRPLAALLIAAAALLVLCLAAWAALAILFPPAKLRVMLEAQASSALSRDTRFGDVSLGIFPPVRLTVRDAALAEPGGFNEGAALSARSVYLDLDVLALLGRRVVVRRLTLDRPVLHLVTRADGTTNFDGLGPEDVEGAARPEGAAPGGLEIAVRDFRIQDGEVLIDDLGERRRTMFDVNARMSLDAAPAGRIRTDGRTEISAVAFGPLSARRREDLSGAIADITWRIEHDGVLDPAQKRLALEKLALGFGRAELAFQGIVDDPGAKARVDLAARGTGIDLGEILRILAEADARALNGLSGSGNVAFDLRVRGALGGKRLPDLTGTIGVADAAFRYAAAEAGVEDLSFTARFAPDSLTIDDLVANVAVQERNATPVRARFAVWRFENPQVRFAVAGDVDLAAVSPLLAEQNTKLAGRARVDLRGAGPAKDPGAISLEGRGALQNVSVEAPDLPNRVDRINGSFTASKSVVRIEGLTAAAGASSFTLDGRVERPFALTASTTPREGETPIAPARVSFTLTSPHLDLAELLPVGPGGPLLPNATGTGTVDIARLKGDRLDVTHVKAEVGLEPGIVRVPAFTFDGYGGEVAGRARFDLHDPAKPVFALNATVANVEANDILSVWTPADDLIRGNLNSNIELSGEGVSANDLARSLTAVGLASIANGTFGPGPTLTKIAEFTSIPQFKTLDIRDGTFPFAIEDGRVSFREVRFAGPTGEWRVAGSVGFDGTLDYAVSATLPADVVSQLGSAGAIAAGALKDPSGQLLLDLRVTGPAKSLRVSWDKSAMLDRLMGRASQALREKGEKLGVEALQALGERGGGTPDTSLADYQDRLKAVADSLKKLKARDVLKNLFGGGKQDTVW